LGEQEPPTVRVRVDRGLGRIFLSAMSGTGGGGEVAIDVLPSQMPAIAAAFDGGDPPMGGGPAMSPEELEGLKAKIMRMTKPKVRFYPGEIAVKLGLEHDVVIEAIHSLQREGKLIEHDD